MIRHLLLIGHNLSALVDLSISLASSFSTTTLAATADLAARARAPDAASFDAILILLDGQEPLSIIQSLANNAPRVVFLAGESEALIRDQLRAAGGLVIDADELPIVIAASLLASGPHRERGARVAKNP